MRCKKCNIRKRQEIILKQVAKDMGAEFATLIGMPVLISKVIKDRIVNKQNGK